MTTKYHLEIYEPGSNGTTVAAHFTSSTPFGHIAPGDLVNLPDAPSPTMPGSPWQVTKIEHGLWNAGPDVTHKVMLFVEEIPKPQFGTMEIKGF
ncbi:hypothetical protein [Oleomonas cavernae]|uniref:hypothetical protein n=1 Tax=Oleomonas cavernae TaxID=2320859 RepID=UPI0011C3D206|nr:hypothetical protein [Oleomonas cavernae]